MTKKEMFDYLVNAGATQNGAAAVMGHIQAESAFRANNVQNSYEKKLGMNDEQYTAACNNGSYSREQFSKDAAGYSYAQWTYWSRKQAYWDYLTGHGYPIGDEKGSLEFLIYEMKAYKPVWAAVCDTSKTLREISDIIMKQYERPADQSETACARRAKYGEAIFNEIAKANLNSGNGQSVTTPTTPEVDWEKKYNELVLAIRKLIGG